MLNSFPDLCYPSLEIASLIQDNMNHKVSEYDPFEDSNYSPIEGQLEKI